MAETPTELVQRFCDAWSAQPFDVAALGSFFSDDAVYHNIPMDPMVGRANIEAGIAGFTAGVDAMEFRMVNIVGAGNLVMTERIDAFTYPNAKAALPVMGVFEVADGKIVAWRDYFDVQQFASQLTPPEG